MYNDNIRTNGMARWGGSARINDGELLIETEERTIPFPISDSKRHENDGPKALETSVMEWHRLMKMVNELLSDLPFESLVFSLEIQSGFVE